MVLCIGTVAEGYILGPSNDSRLDVVGACAAGIDEPFQVMVVTSRTSCVVDIQSLVAQNNVSSLQIIPSRDLRGSQYQSYSVAESGPNHSSGTGTTHEEGDNVERQAFAKLGSSSRAHASDPDQITSVRPLSGGKLLVAGTHHGRVLVLSTSTCIPAIEYAPHSNEVSSISVSPIDGAFLTASWDGSWRVYCDEGVLRAAREGGATQWNPASTSSRASASASASKDEGSSRKA